MKPHRRPGALAFRVQAFDLAWDEKLLGACVKCFL